MKYLIAISDSDGTYRYRRLLKEKLVNAIKTDLKIFNDSNESSSINMSHVLQINREIQEWKGENLNSNLKDKINTLSDLQAESITIWMNKGDNKRNRQEITTMANDLLERLKN